MNKLLLIRRLLTAALLAAASILSVIFNREKCAEGIINGLDLCGRALLPSVLPFMIISSFSVKSGAAELIGKLIDKPCKLIFKISGQSAAVVIIGMLGGYPVAAKGLEALRESGIITEREAAKTALAAVCSGSGFTVSFVGASLLNSPEIGTAIFISQILSVIILLFANRFIFADRDEYISISELKTQNLSDSFIESVSGATNAAVEMCAMVIVFSAINSILGERLPFLSVILEVTNACNILCKNNNILLLAFAIGFGGISVHFQILQSLRKIKISFSLFFIYRIIQGLLTTALAFAFIKTFKLSSPVFSSISATPRLGLSTSITGSILLILTGISLIYNFHKRGEYNVRNSRNA